MVSLKYFIVLGKLKIIFSKSYKLVHAVFKDVFKTGNGQRTGGLTGKLKMETRPQPHYLSGPR